MILCFYFFFFSKIIPSFFVDKASCTRQFESELSLHSLASLFPIKEGFFLPLRLSCKESSTFSPSPSSSGNGDVTALLGAQNRYALRLADHQRSTPDCAGWDRLDAMLPIPNLKPHLHESAKSKDKLNMLLSSH